MKATLAALLMLLSLYSARAAACSCMLPGSPAEEAARATEVFMGEVVGVEDSQPPDIWWTRLLWRFEWGPNPAEFSSARPIHYTFRVLEPFTGTRADTVVVVSAAEGASCGYRFERGRRYVVYATEHLGALRAGPCSLTGLAGDPRSGLAWLRAHQAELSSRSID